MPYDKYERAAPQGSRAETPGGAKNSADTFPGPAVAAPLPELQPRSGETPRTDQVWLDYCDKAGGPSYDGEIRLAALARQLERELAEMTRFRDMNNAELGRMTEKCNSLNDTIRSTSGKPTAWILSIYGSKPIHLSRENGWEIEPVLFATSSAIGKRPS